MTKIFKYLLRAGALALLGLSVSSCGIYSFSGTSIQPDVHSITVNFIENRALLVNPELSNLLTEELIDKYRKLTSLDILDEGGDLEVGGEITGYDVRPTTVTADEVAAQNRLTITVKMYYVNNKHPEENFESKSFSAYEEYDSTQSLDAVQSSLCQTIVETIVEDIFNATVANW
ncbi:MAG: LptE family protein [Muribaculum sp.]|uniref:LptE family protein n=1 Tax=Candidatus Merdivivens faecigallinarum TaxID=2840871 RepID=A0A9D9NPX6_9BACT|nr:LptE family protein [Candidatus Merdivivens faecigallinarum]